MVNLKQERWADALKRIFDLRLGAGVTAKAYDGNKDVYLTVKESGIVQAIVKFETIAAPANSLLDGLDLTQRVYTPNLAKVAFDGGASVTPASEKLRAVVSAEVGRLGCSIYVYSINKGASDLVIGDVTGTPVAVIEDIDWSFQAGV